MVTLAVRTDARVTPVGLGVLTSLVSCTNAHDLIAEETLTTQKATQNAFEPELGHFFQFVLEMFVLEIVTHPSLDIRGERACVAFQWMQGYLAHKKTPIPLGPSQDPRHKPTVGS